MKPYLTRILQAAIRSPSGDNCQPWVFRIPDDKTIIISTDAGEPLNFFDYQLHGALMSLGAVIENIRTQGAAECFSVTVDYGQYQSDGEYQVRLELVPDSAARVEPGRVQAMLERTVNRRPYLPLRNSPETLSELLREPVAGTTVTAVNTLREIFRWSRIVYVADRIRYSHPVIHREMFACLLMDDESVQRRRAGLEIRRLGAGPIIGPVMRLIKPWDRMASLLRMGMDRLLASQSRLMSLLSASLIMVSIDQDSPEQWILAGEQMQRIWISAQQMGLGVHPVTVGLYLDHRYQEEGLKDYLPQHEPLLREVNEALKPLLRGKIGAIIFRVGRGLPMKDTAVRRPLEHFVGGEP